MSAIPSWAVRGAKVVCVKRPFGLACTFVPKKGEQYTIDLVGEGIDDSTIISLQEGVSLDKTGQPVGFAIWCFRPLITRTQEQDVAKFKHLLNSTPDDLERAE